MDADTIRIGSVLRIGGNYAIRTTETEKSPRLCRAARILIVKGTLIISGFPQLSWIRCPQGTPFFPLMSQSTGYGGSRSGKLPFASVKYTSNSGSVPCWASQSKTG